MIHIFHKWHYIGIGGSDFRVCEKCGKIQECHSSENGDWHITIKDNAWYIAIDGAFEIHLKDPDKFRPSFERWEKTEFERLKKAIETEVK